MSSNHRNDLGKARKRTRPAESTATRPTANGVDASGSQTPPPSAEGGLANFGHRNNWRCYIYLDGRRFGPLPEDLTNEIAEHWPWNAKIDMRAGSLAFRSSPVEKAEVHDILQPALDEDGDAVSLGPQPLKALLQLTRAAGCYFSEEDLAKILDISPSSISHHIRKIRARLELTNLPDDLIVNGHVGLKFNISSYAAYSKYHWMVIVRKFD